MNSPQPTSAMIEQAADLARRVAEALRPLDKGSWETNTLLLTPWFAHALAKAAEQARQETRELVKEFLAECSHPELDDDRMGYVVCQISRCLLEQALRVVEGT